MAGVRDGRGRFVGGGAGRHGVTDIDRGAKALMGRLRAADAHVVTVGVQGQQADDDHEGISNVRLASVHEFGATINHPGGTRYVIGGDGRARFVSNDFNGPVSGVTEPHEITIPERSFIRATVEGNGNAYRSILRAEMDKVLTNKTTPQRSLELLGLKVESDIKGRIEQGVGPPLAASTLRKKTIDGKVGSTPLIDSGQLRNSITSRVRKEADSTDAVVGVKG